jgi:hypothetical protein
MTEHLTSPLQSTRKLARDQILGGPDATRLVESDVFFKSLYIIYTYHIHLYLTCPVILIIPVGI